ncbi:hypothetical protein [Clostridium sp. CCUG 7971]|uniref:hypothetical protein n=1 Tax=Clostridium sp. CCUG 7971 TaxID=2811414 RepID=UPI001ABA46DD|nr:hypothetical protein [Clostridium sp. CCUG 7971]MBO3443311.1 hypothetical protein [Clostridium sp. CCUG 7971]
MSKKHSIYVVLIVILLIMIASFVNNKNNENNENTNEKNRAEDIEPLSKKHAINILKAEYGDYILANEDDIKIKGDEYIIDVSVYIEDDEPHEDLGEHEHEQSLGVHKINMYTGELIIPDESTENK